MTAEQWVDQFAKELDTGAPSKEEFDEVLRLAAAAAHASERTAAPLACWIAGRTGTSLAAAIEIAERIERS